VRYEFNRKERKKLAVVLTEKELREHQGLYSPSSAAGEQAETGLKYKIPDRSASSSI
jgi:hypothetical protein